MDSGAELDWRQLGALDWHGIFSVYHGEKIYSVFDHSAGRNCLALGNILDNEHVTEAMRDAFKTAKVAPLSERLLLALEAAQNAQLVRSIFPCDLLPSGSLMTTVLTGTICGLTMVMIQLRLSGASRKITRPRRTYFRI